jgi:hypothetical protein
MADSKIVKATMAAGMISSLIRTSGKAKYVKNMINNRGKLRIVSTIKANICDNTGTFAYRIIPTSPPMMKLRIMDIKATWSVTQNPSNKNLRLSGV